ncbi:2-phosphosulfolactate phosphatase [Lentibacillus persicus]|uniref:Probable 2-phosphosulfolactate phosphatase n=1 Tax=Lentibacillus persicus TaxID=640948 RepID=A0A1I1SAT2_9BACI|nr:2-phosphosulfolactate phosphatase [Lentibacillus persicus]SFD43599.1 2-phosphosulfolactate phosphatase [Lentibacillus persicus]
MRKIHVILKKEDVDERYLDNKIAVVFDILLATTTITTALEHGAREVIPVLDQSEAKEVIKAIPEGNGQLVGEDQGLTIEGFISPDPLALTGKISDKTMVLCTTNGTVALKKVLSAKSIYAASLLNSVAVARRLLDNCQDETILLVCAGSSGEFCVEDFYGAGYFIECLIAQCKEEEWDLTDAALSAFHFARGIGGQAAEIFHASRVGKMLTSLGMRESIDFAAKKDVCRIVPYIADRATLRIDEK